MRASRRAAALPALLALTAAGVAQAARTRPATAPDRQVLGGRRQLAASIKPVRWCRDFTHADMRIHRPRLRAAGPC